VNLTFAGTGHGHSHKHGHSHDNANITLNKTKEIGIEEIGKLIKNKKIHQSWKDSTYEKSEKKVFSGKTEWVVTFTNKNAVKGKRLYLFLKLSGHFIAANFSGK
jgi:hypothetical protein